MARAIPFHVLHRLLSRLGFERRNFRFIHGENRTYDIDHDEGTSAIAYRHQTSDAAILLRWYDADDEVPPVDLACTRMTLDSFGLMDRVDFDDFAFAAHLARKQERYGYIAKHDGGEIRVVDLNSWRSGNVD